MGCRHIWEHRWTKLNRNRWDALQSSFCAMNDELCLRMVNFHPVRAEPVSERSREVRGKLSVQRSLQKRFFWFPRGPAIGCSNASLEHLDETSLMTLDELKRADKTCCGLKGKHVFNANMQLWKIGKTNYWQPPAYSYLLQERTKTDPSPP